MQLAAQRIALNLREAGFNVQVVSFPGLQHSTWCCAASRLNRTSRRPHSNRCCGGWHAGAGVANTPAVLYRVESTIPRTHTDRFRCSIFPVPMQWAAECAICDWARTALRCWPGPRWRTHMKKL